MTESLWEQLSEAARRAAIPVVGGDKARDVAQEALVLLLKTRLDIRDPIAFVRQTARLVALSFVRSDQRRISRERAFCDSCAARSSPLSEPICGELVYLSLAAGDRLLVRLLEAGHSVREIAERMGRSTSAVRRRIEALRAQFGRVPSAGSGSGRRTSRTSRPTIWKKRSA